MTGGEWLIRQHPPNGHGGWLTERVTVEERPATASGSEPNVIHSDHALVFRYIDGREHVFPWANIVSAEYRPHTEP